MTSFTFENPQVTMARGFAVEKQSLLIVLLHNMLSLVTDPHWSVVAYRLLSYTANMPPEREASPNLQHYNLAIEKARVGKEEAGDLVMVPMGSELVVGVLERLPCLSD